MTITRDIETNRKFYSVAIPKWMRRKFGRWVRTYKHFSQKERRLTRFVVTEPDESLSYYDALSSFRAGEFYQFED